MSDFDEAGETAAFYRWFDEKRHASYAAHAAAYSRNDPMPDSWGRFSELAEKEAWLTRARLALTVTASERREDAQQ